jgi:NADPH:quinone reductase-like Zn-dependent oxidoreductase
LDLQPGQRVLIHAGAGGLGCAAIQIAKARGLHVTTTCSTRNMQFVWEVSQERLLVSPRSTVKLAPSLLHVRCE